MITHDTATSSPTNRQEFAQTDPAVVLYRALSGHDPYATGLGRELIEQFLSRLGPASSTRSPVRDRTGPFDSQFKSIVGLIENTLDDTYSVRDDVLEVVADPQVVSTEWRSRVSAIRSIEHPDFELPDSYFES